MRACCLFTPLTWHQGNLSCYLLLCSEINDGTMKRKVEKENVTGGRRRVEGGGGGVEREGERERERERERGGGGRERQ